MSLDVFSPALAPATRPEFDDFEPAPCASVYWLPPGHVHHGASLRCVLDADHTGCGVDVRHGRGLTRWTTAEAAAALADFGPRPAASCYEGCNRPVVAGGRCAGCLTGERERDENRGVIEA